MVDLLFIEAVVGFRISRGESHGDLTKKAPSLSVNMGAAQELLGPRSRDAGINVAI